MELNAEISLTQINIDRAKLCHIRKELQGYYTGTDLDTHTIETFENFKRTGADPRQFQFMEETRFNENEFKVDTWLGWKLKGADYGSVLIIKD